MLITYCFHFRSIHDTFFLRLPICRSHISELIAIMYTSLHSSVFAIMLLVLVVKYVYVC